MGVFLRYYAAAAAALALDYGMSAWFAGLSAAGSSGAEGAAPLELAHPTLRLLGRAVLWYAAAALGLVGSLIYANVCPQALGKDPRTGRVPAWSHALFWSAHAWNYCFVRVTYWKRKRRGIAAATEVLDGWYLGGCFLDEVEGVAAPWACVVDLTNEFDERGAVAPENYLNLPTWDGQPPDERRFDEVGAFVAARAGRGRGPVVVHCAFGVGRSTCVLCVALVVAGKFPTYQAAFAAIKAKRLNPRMRAALERWQAKREK